MRATANLMRAFTHALDPDTADEKALRRYERAGITLSPLLDGGFAIAGTADETTGAAIVAAIDAAAPLVNGDTRTAARRRLDGLHRLWPGTGSTPPPPTATPPTATARRTSRSRARLIVTLDHAGLAGQHLTRRHPDLGRTHHRHHRAAPRLRHHRHLRHPRPRRQRRRSRHPTPVLHHQPTLAMIARDGDTCPAPCCDRPSAWSDGHHLTPVADGGPTTIANGALPCEGHHVQLHEGHWTLERLPDGRYLMRHPRTGKTLGPEPPRPGHNRPPPPALE